MKRREVFSLALAVALATQPIQAQDTASGASPLDPRKTEADIEAAQANARKAQAEAKKAEQDLYTGIVTAAGGRGTATVNAGAGMVEATSVATDALDAIGEALSPQIRDALTSRSSSKAGATPPYCQGTNQLDAQALVIVSSTWQPDTAIIDLIDPALTVRMTTAKQLETRANISIGLIKAELANVAKPKKALGAPPAGGIAPALVMAGASALMAAMKTDVELFGVSLSSGDAILLRIVAGQIKIQDAKIPLFIPEVVSPSRGPGRSLMTRFAALDKSLGELTYLQAQFGSLAGEAASGATAAGEKTPLGSAYSNIGKHIAQLRSPLDAFVAIQQPWLASLQDVSKGKSLAQVASEQAEIGCIAAVGGVVVRVKADAFGGSIFTRKNLWTTFGGTPIFVSAGAVVSYSFNDLWTGEFLTSGVIRNMSKWTPIIDAGPRGKVKTTGF